jgi:hypothetical protein
MQLRSGRNTLTRAPVAHPRRESRNYEEFNERRRYQEEQKQIEESIYETDDNEEQKQETTPLETKWKAISKRIKHLLYFIECQKKQKCSFTEKVKTIKEIYEFLLYNMDDLIELFNGEMKHKKKFPEVIYMKGIQLRCEIKTAKKRTRSEEEMALECNDLINHVTQLIHRYIISKHF